MSDRDELLREALPALEASLKLWEADSRLWPTADKVIKPLIDRIKAALSDEGAPASVAEGLSPREKWLVKEGYIAGFCKAGGVPLRNQRISDLAEEWLDSSVADAVTVEMALTHEAALSDRAGVVVPEEPTIAMCKAGAVVLSGNAGRLGQDWGTAKQVYLAMLRAAQTNAAAPQGRALREEAGLRPDAEVDMSETAARNAGTDTSTEQSAGKRQTPLSATSEQPESLKPAPAAAPLTDEVDYLAPDTEGDGDWRHAYMRMLNHARQLERKLSVYTAAPLAPGLLRVAEICDERVPICCQHPQGNECCGDPEWVEKTPQECVKQIRELIAAELRRMAGEDK